MEKTLLSQDKNVKKYLIKFSKDEIEKIENQIVREINQHYTFEGFRKGKVPKQVIKLRLGSDFNNMLLDEAEHELDHKIREEEKLLFPITVESRAQDEEHIEFEVLIHTYPEIIKTEFENMTVKIPESKEVVEDFVQRRLDDLLESNAILDPKEEPIQYGDYVRINYDLVEENGEVIKSNEEEEILVREDDERELVKKLIGKTAGDEFELEKEDQGKKVIQKVRIAQAYTRRLPELNDNFAKELNIEVESLNELNETLRKEGEEAVKNWQDQFVINYILSELPNYVDIDISEESLNYYVDATIRDLKNKDKYEENLKKYDNDENKLKEDIKKSALNWIKEMIIIEELSLKNNIKVENDEISQEIKNFSTMYGLPFSRAQEIISSNPELSNEIVWNKLREKVAQFIKEKVQIVEISKDESEGGNINPTEEGKEEKPNTDNEVSEE
ncbi:MAG TPA: trigger factor [Petrotoga sp.]|nr:MAG: Trigger factor [Petrotoga mobilis]HBT51094.1 trigger factor [Petrotoga sp.]